MKNILIVTALALAIVTLNSHAQQTSGPPPAVSGPSGGPGHGSGGFHLLPPHAKEQLNLTADQQKQLTDLETEVKGKLEKILTADQLQQLKQMRPPQRQGGRGGGGPGGGDSNGSSRPPGPPPDNDPNQ